MITDPVMAYIYIYTYILITYLHGQTTPEMHTGPPRPHLTVCGRYSNRYLKYYYYYYCYYRNSEANWCSDDSDYFVHARDRLYYCYDHYYYYYYARDRYYYYD